MPPPPHRDTTVRGRKGRPPIISQNGESTKSSASQNNPVAPKMPENPANGGSQIPKAKSTSRLADARGMNV